VPRHGIIERMTDYSKAILAGGCFWGMQDLIRKQPGVVSTRVGYTGGDVPNATYRNHGTHAEAIEIIYDPARTDFRTLLEYFFQIHDPTTKNRQGNDIGARARAPGLPGALPQRIHLPLPPAGLEVAATRCCRPVSSASPDTVSATNTADQQRFRSLGRPSLRWQTRPSPKNPAPPSPIGCRRSAPPRTSARCPVTCFSTYYLI
jgi:hypothetical protein